ncbi:regulatory protein RecX [Buchananella felis]|uniref:regulatory protein RecX n=1 Tax=Buchananella felis TaxID=3231492 RepID=UPI0035286FBF
MRPDPNEAGKRGSGKPAPRRAGRERAGRERAGREPGGAPASLEELLRSGLVQLGTDGLGAAGKAAPPPRGRATTTGGRAKTTRGRAKTTRGRAKTTGTAADGTQTPVGELPLEQQVDLAREAALKSLTVCARTRQQLTQSLGRKGFAQPAVESVLDRLTEVGLIDDAAYAAALVRTRAQEKGLARKAIAVELARKGIDRQDAAAALDQLSEDDERATALGLARAKARATARLDYPVRLRRIVAHLGRKGYNSEVALSAARAALAEEWDRADDQ